MPFSVTCNTNFRLASPTNAILLAILVFVYILRLYPLATSSSRTVYTVFGSVLRELPIPGFLEGNIEEVVDMMERNMITSAASRWHMLGVCNREFEISFQTGMAHSMATFQFWVLGGGDVVC